ncbi:MAG: SIMPL domain-containing protein [Polyangia bacterium]|jgi:uncharacterized protein YggE|nr:SIMPL domain-containing protein [Polyangia bacterium]
MRRPGKTRSCWLLVTAFAALSGATPALAEQARPRTLSVQGEGRVDTAPDSVRVMVGIETLEPSLSSSRARNADVFAKVVAAVARAGVPGVLVKSDDVRVELVYEQSYPQGRLPKVLGYRIYNSVTIRAVERDPAKLSRAGSLILDRAVGAGANRIRGVEFFVSDTRATYKKAMLFAIEDARRNAADMAKHAGVTLAGVQSISPSWGRYYPELSSTGGGYFHHRHAYTQAASVGSGGSGMSVAAGRFQVKASVSMVFELK